MRISSLVRIAAVCFTIFGLLSLAVTFTYSASIRAEREIYIEQEHLITLGADLTNLSDTLTRNAMGYVQFGEWVYYDMYEVFADQKTENMQSMINAMNQRGATQDETGAATQAMNSVETLSELEKEAFDAIMRVDFNTARSIMFGERYNRIKEEFHQAMITYENLVNARISNALDLSRQKTRMMDAAATITQVAMVLFGIASMLVIAKKINPINKLVEASIQIANGNLNKDISYGSKDEIGDLYLSFNQIVTSVQQANRAINNQVESMITGRLSDRTDASEFKGDWVALFDGLNSVVDAIMTPINEMTAVLDEISKNNYTARMDGQYKGDWTLIKNSLNSTIESINDYISKIHMLATVITNADAGIIIRDIDGTITSWNKGAEKILGFSEAEMTGSKMYAGGETEQKLIDNETLRVADGESLQTPYTVRTHKDGSIINCSFSTVPIYDADGKVTGSFSIFSDISDQLAMEGELKKAQDNTVAILRAIPAPICAVDSENGKILECNAAFVVMCGAQSESDIVGNTLESYIKRKDPCADDGSLVRILAGNASVPCSVEKLDGTELDAEIFSRPLVYQDKDALAVYCVDLTKQREQEQALKAAADAADDANQTKSRFLANMSHEIRTPMNGIIGLADLALDDDISPKTLDYLSKIKNSADSLLHIVNDILDLSKIEANETTLEKIPFDLREVFSECKAIGAAKAEEKGLRVYFYCESYQDRKLIGDPTRLRQVLLNFLSNAIKFTEKGVVTVTAKPGPVENEPDKVEIYFEIKDSGIGMTKKQVARIFDPFKQADTSTTRKYGGTGLGLAITKNIVNLMGGEITVDSVPSLGSKFSFTLIFDLSNEKIEAGNIYTNKPAVMARPVFSGDVLVCEDNSTNQQVAREHLEKIGLRVTIAENGKRGVEDVFAAEKAGTPFDLIFMDIHMPIMDGMEATEMLVRENIKTPVIAMTANAMEKDRELCLSIGMTDYISKPFRAQDLYVCLLKYLVPVGQVSEEGGNEVKHETVYEGNEVINAKVGLERSAGSEKLYKKLLQDFLTDKPCIPEQLKKAIGAKDFTLARHISHTEKSVAATIGALRLSALAQELERSFSAETPVTDIKLFAAYCDELGVVLDHITKMLDSDKKNNARTSKKKTSGIVDRTKALKLMDELQGFLEVSNSQCLDYIDEIRETLAPLGDDKCEDLISKMEDYDFDLAIQVLDAMREELPV